MRNLSYENEFCTQFLFRANKSHFHKNGFALRLALKQRHKGTRKWPIGFCQISRLENEIRRPEHAHASCPGFSFRPPGFSGKKGEFRDWTTSNKVTLTFQKHFENTRKNGGVGRGPLGPPLNPPMSNDIVLIQEHNKCGIVVSGIPPPRG